VRRRRGLLGGGGRWAGDLIDFSLLLFNDFRFEVGWLGLGGVHCLVLLFPLLEYEACSL
jgi:hypothetical protein